MSWDICDTVAAGGGFMCSPSGSRRGKHPGTHGEVPQPRSSGPDPAPTLSVKRFSQQLSPGSPFPWGQTPAWPSPSAVDGKGGEAPSASSCDAGGLPPMCWTRRVSEGALETAGMLKSWKKQRSGQKAWLNPPAAGLPLPGVRSQLGCERPPAAGGTFRSPGVAGGTPAFAERRNSCFQTANKCEPAAVVKFEIKAKSPGVPAAAGVTGPDEADRGAGQGMAALGSAGRWQRRRGSQRFPQPR